MARRVSADEVAAHNKPDDVWIVVNGRVYDFTAFAPRHPGGADAIYRHAGCDASREYGEVHAPGLIEATLSAAEHIGELDGNPGAAERPSRSSSSDGAAVAAGRLPPLGAIINLYDFEAAARAALPARAFAYISSGSNDNVTRDANDGLLKRILLRPRVMRDVTAVRTAARLFGEELAVPLYIAPMGQGKAGGPEGELALARAADAAGIMHVIPTPASFAHADILAATPRRALFQVYVNKDRSLTEAMLRRVVGHATGDNSSKVKALVLTADLAVVSKREADQRAGGGGGVAGPGMAKQTGGFIDPSVSWDDVAWLRRAAGRPQLPVCVKGVQHADDARAAVRAGADAIVVSNHGGRAVDTAPPAILTLLELHRACPEVFDQVPVLVDGGFRRGADVVKAVCLGASAVGIGRPFMYSLAYGQAGVEHAVNIIRDEIETAMRLCGMTDLMRDAHPDFVNSADIDHLVPGPHHPYARKINRPRASL